MFDVVSLLLGDRLTKRLKMYLYSGESDMIYDQMSELSYSIFIPLSYAFNKASKLPWPI